MYRAALWCERPENHAELASLLSEPRYVGISAQLLLRGLTGRLVLTPDDGAKEFADFYLPASRVAASTRRLWVELDYVLND